MTDYTGTRLGKYQLQERLGRGGMAEVYKACQPGLERLVAIKILYPHLADTPDFVNRFRREAQAIALLHHPHIVQVYDFDVEADRHYMVMEYIEGQTLKARLDEYFVRGELMPLPDVLRLFHAVLDAVGYAHDHHVVHRDLKPGNLLIEPEGRPVLTDFGIAKIVGGSGRHTTTGVSMGTPYYMSPEQGQGESGDSRSDIYALGIMLYECLTGQVPYDGDTSITIMLKHIGAPVPALRQVRPDLSPALEAVVTKALAKSPDARYQAAAEMWAALQAAGEDSELPAPAALVAEAAPPVRMSVALARPPARPRTPRGVLHQPVSRQTPALALSAVVVVALFIVGGLLALPGLRGPSPAEQAVSQGQSLLAQGKYQLAADQFNSALNSEPHNIAALLGRAQANEALNAPDQAWTDVVQVVALAPHNPAGYEERARLGLQYGLNPDLTAVQADLDRAIALAPKSARPYFLRGWARLNFPLTGGAPDPAGALPDLQKAVELDPQNADAQLTLAQALQAVARPTEALAPASRAVELSPQASLPRALRARLQFKLGDYHSAIDDLTAAIGLETDPTELAGLLTERGYLNLRLQAPAEARHDLDQALGHDPTAVLPHYLQLLLDPTLPRPDARQVVLAPEDAIWQAITADLLKQP
jgi:tetratricopeptide (TPR) repeat protein